MFEPANVPVIHDTVVPCASQTELDVADTIWQELKTQLGVVTIVRKFPDRTLVSDTEFDESLWR
jgi:hypothetical protein